MQPESLRQWPHITELTRRLAKLPGYRATIAIGSLAAGTADDLSDIDVYVAFEDGAFDDAWSRRDSIRPPDALHWWDIRTDDARELAVHNWITRDILLVECAFATPSGEPRLAPPYRVLDGDEHAVESFVPIEPITRAALDDYNDELTAEGLLPPIQLQYGTFMHALRASIATRSDPSRESRSHE